MESFIKKRIKEFAGACSYEKQYNKFFNKPDEPCEDDKEGLSENLQQVIDLTLSKMNGNSEFIDELKVKQQIKEEAFIESFNLADGILAKEILDKPLCKRRRRARGVR